jgi:uncharacterized SAM-binding protein YcdF (DUF218 family)
MKLKLRYILICLLALALTSLASFVMPPYDNSKPPKLSLPDAYQFAIVAMGPATNQFHCVGANITTDFGDPRWSFTFCSTNKMMPTRWMTVDFSGKTQEDNGLR